MELCASSASNLRRFQSKKDPLPKGDGFFFIPPLTLSKEYDILLLNMISYKVKLHAKARNDGYLDDKITRYLRLYNRIVDISERFYKRYGRLLRTQTLSRYIVIKKKDPAWSFILEDLNSWAVQDTLRRRDEGLNRFFKYLKKREKNPNFRPKESPPQFHNSKGPGSYTLARGQGHKIEANTLVVGRLWNSNGREKDIREYKWFGNRQILGKEKKTTIMRDAYGDFWACITTDYNPSSPLPKTGKIGGFDFSPSRFFIGDDGRSWDIPLVLEEELEKLQYLRRRLDNAQKGSKNKKRWQKKLSSLWRHVTWRREAFHYQIAWQLCKEYDVLCFEDNDYADMRRKGRFINGRHVTKKERRHLVALSPATFIKIIKDVAKKTGKTVWLADRYFASSQKCSECGYINSSIKDPKIREWKCPKCGKVHNRDINAAKNLKQEYLRTVGGAPSIETKTDIKPARESYWERIRKSAARKRAAGLGEYSPRPRNHISKEKHILRSVTVCPELYTDATTVQNAGGSDNSEAQKAEIPQETTAPP